MKMMYRDVPSLGLKELGFGGVTANTVERVFIANKNMICVAGKVFDESPKRDEYIRTLDPKPPDECGSPLHISKLFMAVPVENDKLLYGERVELAKVYYKVLKTSVRQHFKENGVIASMEHCNDLMVLGTEAITLGCVRDDFWCTDPSGDSNGSFWLQGCHMVYYAYNSVWMDKSIVIVDSPSTMSVMEFSHLGGTATSYAIKKQTIMLWSTQGMSNNQGQPTMPMKAQGSQGFPHQDFPQMNPTDNSGTIGKHLSSINVENVETNRKALRELLFCTPGCLQYLSGVILFEETLYQSTAAGKPFVDVLEECGVLPGINVDKGTVELAGTNSETITQGLDGLTAHCAKYYEAGARFAKWRVVLNIGPNEPSQLAINENVNGLARYAIICQENGLVPIVEPEILVDGSHDINKCADVTERILAACYKALNDPKVLLEGTLLKPNMVTHGSDSKKVAPEVITEYTVRALQRTMPPTIPVVVFLPGGQSDEEATVNLNAMNKLQTKNPWSLSFSFGRALQQSTLKAWAGKPENVSLKINVKVREHNTVLVSALERRIPFVSDRPTIIFGACLYPPQEFPAIKVASEKISNMVDEMQAEVDQLNGCSEAFLQACTGLRTSLRQLGSEPYCSSAVIIGISIGASLEDIVKGIEEVDAVPSRCEVIDEEHTFGVTVDYVHTPDALSQGEYVVVENIESTYSRCPLVTAIWVYGNSFESFPLGVVVPERNPLEVWAVTNNVFGDSGDSGDFELLCKNGKVKFDPHPMIIESWVALRHTVGYICVQLVEFLPLIETMIAGEGYSRYLHFYPP